MEEIDQNIDPELEVKKLQDLVKKLEKQNEQLRNARRSGQSITDSPTKQRKMMTSTQQKNREQELNKKLANMSLDEVDLVKIMSDDDEDDEEKEDSWLYVSPARSATPTHKNTSPYKWVRQDFEKSSPEVDSTRQSLLLKLDECSRASKWSSASSPSRSGTLTPSTPLDEAFLRRKESDDADDEDEDSYKLQDMTDVQVMARIQEESLRQELSPRRLSSPRQRPDTLPYDDGDPFPEDEYESPRNLYYSPRDSRSSSRSQSPQRHLGDSPRNQSPKVQRKQYYTNDDNRSGSSNLSGSNSSLHSTPVNGEGRVPATNQQSSPSRNSQNQESKMRTPTSTGSPAAQSQSGLRQPQLRQSGSGIPRGTGIPTRQSPQAKSGIPRPGQRRGIPVPKSGIPTPGSGIPRAGMRGMRGDDNWREGCY